MGDRGNILIEGVYLYTHWAGSDLKKILKRALKKRLRWNDSPYLTRIIFCEMIKHDVEGETGYGISKEVQDNENPILEVNVRKQEITQDGVFLATFKDFIK